VTAHFVDESGKTLSTYPGVVKEYDKNEEHPVRVLFSHNQEVSYWLPEHWVYVDNKTIQLERPESRLPPTKEWKMWRKDYPKILFWHCYGKDKCPLDVTPAPNERVDLDGKGHGTIIKKEMRWRYLELPAFWKEHYMNGKFDRYYNTNTGQEQSKEDKPLPEEWKKSTDEHGKLVYRDGKLVYENTITGETQQKHPQKSGYIQDDEFGTLLDALKDSPVEFVHCPSYRDVQQKGRLIGRINNNAQCNVEWKIGYTIITRLRETSTVTFLPAKDIHVGSCKISEDKSYRFHPEIRWTIRVDGNQKPKEIETKWLYAFWSDHKWDGFPKKYKILTYREQRKELSGVEKRLKSLGGAFFNSKELPVAIDEMAADPAIASHVARAALRADDK